MPFSDETERSLRELGIDSGGSRDDEGEPVDLRAVPVERWEEYLCCPVTLPPAVAKYIAGMTDPPTVQEKDHLEEAIMAHHGMQPPWVVVFRDGVARLMKE